jgi:hypothetical protein
MDAVIEYAMQTPDGAWRVEVVKRGRSRWYRLVNGDNELDWLSIAAVHRLLGEAGIEVSDLDEVTDQPQGPVDSPTHGSPDSCSVRGCPALNSASQPDCTKPSITTSAPRFLLPPLSVAWPPVDRRLL